MQDKFTRMARSLPSLYKAESNTMVRALLKAWGLSDDQINIQIQETKKQLFTETAEARYLDYLGNNVGVPRAAELNISDTDFRDLIPVMSYFPKQVRKTIVSLLDVFWGPGFTRPNISSSNIETFNLGPETILTGTATLKPGENMVVGVGTQFSTEVQLGDYIKATSDDGTFYAKVSSVEDDEIIQLSVPYTGSVAVGTQVSKAIVRDLIYNADKSEDVSIRLKPNFFSDISNVTVVELVAAINQDSEHNERITASVFLDPILGNKLNIRTNTPGLTGSIQIVGGDANDVTRLNFSTEIEIETKANVFEINPNEVVIHIPSSVPVLRRSLKGAAHPKDIKTRIYSVDQSFDLGSIGASSTLELLIDGNTETVTFDHSLFKDSSKATVLEVVFQINAQISSLEAFGSCQGMRNQVGLRTTEGAMEYNVVGGTANTILQFTTDLQQDLDLITANYPSSYIFDPVGQLFTVTGTRSNLSTKVEQGSVNSAITLDDSSVFPNSSGKFMLSYGRNKQEGPVQYNSRPNNSTLLVDASHIFEKEHLAGAMVNLISNGPTLPRVTGSDYPVYVVGTEAARKGAQELIGQLIASGVVIRFVIEFPQYLFTCSCGINCGDDELNSTDYRGSRTNDDPLPF